MKIEFEKKEKFLKDLYLMDQNTEFNLDKNNIDTASFIVW